MSLLCSSESTWDMFHLMKEGGAEPPQHRKSEQRSSERRWQAVFPVGPVSSSHRGTYRCYGSSNSTPNVWSQSSDPLHLDVTGEVADTWLQFFPGPQIPDVNLVPGKALGPDRFRGPREAGQEQKEERPGAPILTPFLLPEEKRLSQQ